MFEILFGWRKASRCKRLIKRVQCRLKLLRNKREVIIRQLREDVAQFIKSGHVDTAFARIEQLSKDESIKSVYQVLDHFSEFIIINLSYIRKHRDCPNDVNEAVSSLLFASARCGDLPELQKLRKLFGERYGQRFAITAVELLPGNLVNRKIIENLSLKSISEDLKLGLLKEIAKDNNLQLEHPQTSEKSELQYHQVSHGNCDLGSEEQFSEKDTEFISDSIDRAQRNEFDALNQHEQVHDKSSSQSDPRTCSSSPSLQHKSESPSRFSDRSIVYLDDLEEFDPSAKKGVNDKDQRLFMFKSIPITRNKSAIVATSVSGSDHDQTDPSEHSDGKTNSRGSSKMRKLAKRRLKRRYEFEENEIHKSPISATSMKDVEHALYYGESGDSSGDEVYSHKSLSQRKHKQNMPGTERLLSLPVENSNKTSAPRSPYHSLKESEKLHMDMSHNSQVSHRKNCGRLTFNHSMAADCSFDRPCYFIPYDDCKSPSSVRRNGNKTLLAIQRRNPQGDCYCSSDEEAFSSTVDAHYFKVQEKAVSYSLKNQEVGRASLSQKPIVRDYKKCTEEVVTPSQSHQLDEQCRGIEEAEVIECRVSCCASSHDSFSRVTSQWTQERPPYMRAMTMPPERPKDRPSYLIPRSISSVSQQPGHTNRSSTSSSPCSHVHPKLPDYDDLAAQFKALKKDRTLNSPNDFGVL